MKARPDQVKFMMVDPKMAELSVYNDIPHLLDSSCDQSTQGQQGPAKGCDEMENRYELC